MLRAINRLAAKLHEDYIAQYSVEGRPLVLVITRRRVDGYYDYYCALPDNDEAGVYGESARDAIGRWVMMYGADYGIEVIEG